MRKPELHKKYSCTLFIALIILLLNACQANKAIFQNTGNNHIILKEDSESNYYEEYMQSIREGAISSFGTNNGGGCGCN